jgi:KaiC/GvpD/RAD55 family RecA-like ATPase
MERIKTYIEGLDEQMEGGIPKDTVSLICGVAGSMKTSLAYSILYNNAVEGKMKGMYITLEQGIQSLKNNMKGLRMWKGGENVVIVDYKQIEKELSGDTRFELNWIKKVGNYVGDKERAKNFELVVIDSLNSIYSLSSVSNPRREVYLFFEGLRETGVTTFLISEMVQNGKMFGRYGVEDFLSDAIIHLDLQRKGSMLERYIGIIKMRYTNHALQYFPLFYNKDRFIIYTRKQLEL